MVINKSAYLGVLLLGDGEPDFSSSGIQLLDGQVFLLQHGQRGIMGELSEDLGDVGTTLA